jgi:hypothetical protein
MGGLGRRGSPRCGAAASLAPFRAVALRARRLPRTAPPAPAAAVPRRNVPDAARRELVPAAMPAPGAPIAGRKSQGPGPERRALSGSAPPASTVLRIRAARGRAYGAPLTPEPLPTQRA